MPGLAQSGLANVSLSHSDSFPTMMRANHLIQTASKETLPGDPTPRRLELTPAASASGQLPPVHEQLPQPEPRLRPSNQHQLQLCRQTQSFQQVLQPPVDLTGMKLRAHRVKRVVVEMGRNQKGLCTLMGPTGRLILAIFFLKNSSGYLISLAAE